MDYPFVVDETYENNKGLYTVVQITPPKMKIKYEDGQVSNVTIDVQARIWERIQTELVMAQEDQERMFKAKRHPITFTGLVESDFKDNVAGTTWRSRSSLGGLVTQQLSDKSGKEFTSWPLYRQTHFFVYPPHVPMTSQQEGVKSPKFIVKLNSDHVFYGFYIEKSDAVMGSEWRWPYFLKMLSEKSWQDKIEQLMHELGLSWVLRLETEIDSTGNYGDAEEVVISSFGDGEKFASFPAFVDYLHKLPPRQWCNLYLSKTIAKSEAIEMEEKISNPISQAFNLLTPMYFRVIQKS